VPRRLAHEAKTGEVVHLALGPLILLGAGGVITGEVEVVEGSTHSGHHLLELLLLLVPEAVLLLVVALVAGVVPVVVVVLVGGVELVPLLAGPVQCSKLSRQQGDLVIRDALVLLIRSCTQGRQSKLQSK
jgi:hypothetical protein